MARIISKLQFFLLLGALAFLVFPLRVQGQGNAIADWLAELRPPDPTEPRTYVNVPVSPGLAAEFQIRLATGQHQDKLRQTLAQIVQDPKKFGFDPELVKQIDFDNPMTKLLVHQWAFNTGGRVNEMSLMQLQGLLADNLKFQKRKGNMQFPVVKLPPLPPPVPFRIIPPSAPVEEDGLTKLMRKFMRDTDASGLGDYLKQSPSWHEGLAKLRGDQAVSAPEDGWTQIVKEWGLADHIKLNWGENTLERMSKLSLPELPRISLNVSNLGLSRPDLQLPRFSAGPGISGVETVLLAILIAGLVLAAWRFFKVKRPGLAATASAALGPWPVAPAQVCTRTQLIAAFEYLAYWRLGQQVKTWNHRLIAAALAPPTSPLAQAADQLSRLYEQARYTPGDDTLQAAEKDQAQRTLLLLAGA